MISQMTLARMLELESVKILWDILPWHGQKSKPPGQVAFEASLRYHLGAEGTISSALKAFCQDNLTRRVGIILKSDFEV